MATFASINAYVMGELTLVDSANMKTYTAKDTTAYTPLVRICIAMRATQHRQTPICVYMDI